MAEVSDRDVLRLSNIFTSGAEKEVFEELIWLSSHISTLLQATPLEMPPTSRPGVVSSWNAVADGEDAFVYLQSWRQRDISQVEHQPWTQSGGIYQDESSDPRRMLYIKDMIRRARTKDSIRSGEEARIVRYKETK